MYTRRGSTLKRINSKMPATRRAVLLYIYSWQMINDVVMWGEFEKKIFKTRRSVII